MGDKMGESLSKLSRLDSVRGFRDKSLTERNGSTRSRGQLHKQDDYTKQSSRRDDHTMRLKPGRDSEDRPAKKPTASSSEEEPLGRRNPPWEEQNNPKRPSNGASSAGEVLHHKQSELLQSIVNEYKQTADLMLEGLQSDRILWRKMSSNLLDKQISAQLELSEVSFGRQLKKICRQEIKHLERILLDAANELDDQLRGDEDCDEGADNASPGSCSRTIENIIAKALKGPNAAPSANVTERCSDALYRFINCLGIPRWLV